MILPMVMATKTFSETLFKSFEKTLEYRFKEDLCFGCIRIDATNVKKNMPRETFLGDIKDGLLDRTNQKIHQSVFGREKHMTAVFSAPYQFCAVITHYERIDGSKINFEDISPGEIPGRFIDLWVTIVR